MTGSSRVLTLIVSRLQYQVWDELNSVLAARPDTLDTRSCVRGAAGVFVPTESS